MTVWRQGIELSFLSELTRKWVDFRNFLFLVQTPDPVGSTTKKRDLFDVLSPSDCGRSHLLRQLESRKAQCAMFSSWSKTSCRMPVFPRQTSFSRETLADYSSSRGTVKSPVFCPNLQAFLEWWQTAFFKKNRIGSQRLSSGLRKPATAVVVVLVDLQTEMTQFCVEWNSIRFVLW